MYWKKIFACLILLISFPFLVEAKKPTSTITFYSHDGSVLQVTVNGRTYKARASQLTLANIPGRRASVEIHVLRPFQDGKGAALQRVYTGSLKIERGERYWAEVQIDKRAIKLSKSAPNQYSQGALPYNIENEYDESNAEMNNMQQQEALAANPLALELIEKMQKVDADREKLQIIQNFSNKEWTVPSMVLIMDALLFDETRLQFLKSQNIEQLSPGQIATLQEHLTSEEAKETLEQLK